MPDQTVRINQGGGADYTSINAAIADSDVTDGFWRMEIEDAAIYTETIDLGGSTGVPTIANYIWLTAAGAGRHDGVLGAGAIIDRTGAGATINLSENFGRLEGLEIRPSNDSASGDVLDINGDNCLIESCFLDGYERVVAGGSRECLENGADVNITLINCVGFNTARAGFYFDDLNGNVNIEFCTIADHGLTNVTGSRRGGINCPRSGGSPARNFYNNAISQEGGLVTTLSYRLDFGDAPTTNASNNASSDDTAPGPNSIINFVGANEWTDPANYDYSIDDQSQFYQAGVNRTATPPDPRADLTVDITGAARPDPPSMGAYDVTAAAPVIGDVNPAAEVDVARPVTPQAAGSVAVAVGTATEADLARGVTPAAGGSAAVDVLPAIESDLAFPVIPIGGTAAVPVGTSAEIDVARPIIPTAAGSAAQDVLPGIEADVARPITPVASGSATLDIGIASEVDSARPIAPFAPGVGIPVNPGIETDVARSITPIAAGAAIKQVGRSIETDVARPITPTGPGVEIVPVDPAVEVDIARTITPVASGALSVPVDPAVEINLARPITPAPGGAAVVPVGLAASNNLGRPIAATQGGAALVPAGAAVEANIARPITPSAAGAVLAPVGLAVELSVARLINPFAPGVGIPVGRALGFELARPITPIVAGAATVVVNRAIELDVSRVVLSIGAGSVAVPLSPAIEADVASLITAIADEGTTPSPLAYAIKAEIDRDGTAIRLIENLQTPGSEPWDLASVIEGLKVDINCKQAPLTAEQFAAGNTVQTDTSVYMPGLDIPAWFDKTSRVELGGIRYQVIDIQRYGTDQAPVGVVAIIRR